MRNFVSPSLEETLMKFSPTDSIRQQPEATYKAQNGWFGVDSLKSPQQKTGYRKRIIKGARA